MQRSGGWTATTRLHSVRCPGRAAALRPAARPLVYNQANICLQAYSLDFLAGPARGRRPNSGPAAAAAP
eukprot:gene1505-23239_t